MHHSPSGTGTGCLICRLSQASARSQQQTATTSTAATTASKTAHLLPRHSNFEDVHRHLNAWTGPPITTLWYLIIWFPNSQCKRGTDVVTHLKIWTIGDLHNIPGRLMPLQLIGKCFQDMRLWALTSTHQLPFCCELQTSCGITVCIHLTLHPASPILSMCQLSGSWHGSSSFCWRWFNPWIIVLNWFVTRYAVVGQTLEHFHNILMQSNALLFVSELTRLWSAWRSKSQSSQAAASACPQPQPKNRLRAWIEHVFSKLSIQWMDFTRIPQEISGNNVFNII